MKKDEIRIHVLHCGMVHTTKYLPFDTGGASQLKVAGSDGRFVLITSDGAYGARSWEEMILPGVAQNREHQRLSLEWIREQAFDKNCVECLANHDTEVRPHVITL